MTSRDELLEAYEKIDRLKKIIKQLVIAIDYAADRDRTASSIQISQAYEDADWC